MTTHSHAHGRFHKPTDAEIQIGVDVGSIEQHASPKKHRSHHVVVSVEGVSKRYQTDGGGVQALSDVTLHLYSGEFAMIYGPSGCGKSTLLHTILGLEEPNAGAVSIRDKHIYEMSVDDRSKLRRQYFGMVFQQSNWIKAFRVWENVGYPLFLEGRPHHEVKKHVLGLLERLGIAEFAYRKPMQLSGGQQQKVALARALATNPRIIVADEPTGNLDSVSGKEMIELLVKLNREEHRMILMVTHDLSLLPLATRRVGLKDGHIIFDDHD
ncbi:MAG TPA: ABC transporter ATP-binding protein [Candidatus Woesebacteria bacterium]|nr:ABC transporter ATP-binding protein [Candidatus Woesebacteria bacterium]